jgi:FtsP/CotA-like multicopper oxidase with cupredoxin domain
VIPSTPVSYQQSRRMITFANVLNHGLLVSPAERADLIIDFSQFAGQTLILYNDCPTPIPGFDPRIDYYTGDPDQSLSGQATGGAPTTQPGYGPNTRTIMMIQVSATAPAPAFNLAQLQAQLPVAYGASQPAPLVPQAVYGPAFATTYTDNHVASVADTAITFNPVTSAGVNTTGTPATIQLFEKAIVEQFDIDWGRMNALLGGVLVNKGAAFGTAMPYSYFDAPTEFLNHTPVATLVGSVADGTQVWRIDHQGVDTHAIHLHLVNVQVIDRIAIDGTRGTVDPNERGWKETIRMNPGEDVFIAIRATLPTLPFAIPNSVRPLDPTTPLGQTVMDANATLVTNQMQDYGHEYVWHCHILGHEENDMMRPLVAINPLVLFTNGMLPAAILGKPYTYTMIATGGSTPYTWAITGGSLPTGVSLNATTGVLSGTPVAGAGGGGGPGTGTFPFSVQVTDVNGAVATATSTLVVENVTITTTTLPVADAGRPYASPAFVATGGIAPYSWSLAAGSTLPSGLSLSTAGIISGTTSSLGTANFTVQVVDGIGGVATKAMSLTVVPSPSITTATPMPGGQINVAYSQTLTGANGRTPYTWARTSGSLPAGLTLSTAGVISGRPTAAGNSSFTVQLTDGNGVSVSKVLSISIASGPSITTTSLPNAERTVAYSQTLTGTSGANPVWSLAPGSSLPNGLRLNASTGAITGTPSATGTRTFTVQLSDASGATASKPLSITVVATPTLTGSALPGGRVTVAYGPVTPTLTGGLAPFTWARTAGTMPPGLVLNTTTGAITGTPTTAGNYSFTLRVTDSAGKASSPAGFSIRVQ